MEKNCYNQRIIRPTPTKKINDNAAANTSKYTILEIKIKEMLLGTERSGYVRFQLHTIQIKIGTHLTDHTRSKAERKSKVPCRFFIFGFRQEYIGRLCSKCYLCCVWTGKFRNQIPRI
jgi:hypothetical protein